MREVSALVRKWRKDPSILAKEFREFLNHQCLYILTLPSDSDLDGCIQQRIDAFFENPQKELQKSLQAAVTFGEALDLFAKFRSDLVQTGVLTDLINFTKLEIHLHSVRDFSQSDHQFHQKHIRFKELEHFAFFLDTQTAGDEIRKADNCNPQAQTTRQSADLTSVESVTAETAVKASRILEDDQPDNRHSPPAEPTFFGKWSHLYQFLWENKIRSDHGSADYLPLFESYRNRFSKMMVGTKSRKRQRFRMPREADRKSIRQGFVRQLRREKSDREA